MKLDAVNHPRHYNLHPSGVECIDIIEHMPSNLSSVFRYLWRAGLKEKIPDIDYNKAVWYLLREMKRVGVKLTVDQKHFDEAR